jgi:putative aldouronate transport system substrate-binding protein
MVAGGDVVDVAWAHVSTLADLAGRGVYQPFGNIFDEAVPDFAARLPQAARLQGTVRGDLYAIPRLVPMAQFNWVWNIRRDLREEWGFSEITTLEQLEAYFLRSLEEGMIPTSDHNSQPLYPVFANYFFPMGDGGNHPIYVDPTDPNFTVRSFWDSDSWRNVADTKVRWRDMGIIAEDESRITGAHQGFVSGIVAGIPSNTNSEIERIDEMKSMMPDAYIETVLLNPGTLRQYIGGDNMLSVGSTSSNVREAVQFIAWIRSNQENFDLWSFGVAGVNHNLTSDGAVTHEGIADNMRYIPNTWMWNDIDLVRFPAAVPAEHINRLRNWDNNAEVTPFIGFVIDASQFSSEFAQVNAVSSEYYQMMTAGLVNLEDIIDELMSQLEAAGLQTLIDGVQAQLNEFLGV